MDPLYCSNTGRTNTIPMESTRKWTTDPVVIHDVNTNFAIADQEWKHPTVVENIRIHRHILLKSWLERPRRECGTASKR